MHIKLFFTFCLSLLSFNVFADELECIPCLENLKKQAESDSDWRTSLEFGLIVTSGNTEGRLAKAKLDMEYDSAHFRNSVLFDFLYKKDESKSDLVDDDGNIVGQVTNKNTTEHKYNIAVQSNYKVSDENKALFARIAYDNNRFSSYEYQSSFSIGYNNRFFNSANGHLDISIGPGYRYDSINVERIVSHFLDNPYIDPKSPLPTNIVNEKERSLQLFLSAFYERKLAENAYFSQNITMESSEDNTKTVAEIALSGSVGSALAVKTSLQIRHNSDVEEGFEKTDTITGATLVYTF